MREIFPGRVTAEIEAPFVVFIIGFRINNFFKFRKWIPVGRAMGPMVRELMADKDKGLLHAEVFFYRRGVGLLQYWKSYDHLETYAREKSGLHLSAWAKFNRLVGDDGSVGIWHETYTVQPGNFEVIYGNMPRFGLGAAANSVVPTTGSRATARERLKTNEKKADAAE